MVRSLVGCQPAQRKSHDQPKAGDSDKFRDPRKEVKAPGDGGCNSQIENNNSRAIVEQTLAFQQYLKSLPDSKDKVKPAAE